MFSTKLKKLLNLTALMVLGLIIGISSAMFYKIHNTVPLRSVASIESYHPSRLSLGKQAAPMNIEIIGPESFPEDSSEIVELVGFITQNIQGDRWIEYKWTLPPGVELIQGPIEDALQNARLGQPQRVSILIKGFSRENQKMIFLGAQIERANTHLTASAVIVSRPEDTMEAKVMDLAAQAKAEAAGASVQK
jgi:hypothetical protein